jgi:phosphoribosyl 1,2-cyclic phosphodiesterase
MKIKFYGVRGSVASAGEETRRYGGNTPCVRVDTGSNVLVFDAGTGIRKLGAELGPNRLEAHLFFSHLHWDHIQGFPFFSPAFVPGNAIFVHGVRKRDDETTREVLAGQMSPPTFPVGLDVMRADLCFQDYAPGESVTLGDTIVRNVPVDHPNGCAAYRVDHADGSVVYATDLEHHADEPDPALVELCRGVDLLVYDAMYTPEEYRGDAGPSRRGWGHSTFEAGSRLADAAEVGSLCLFHHDPAHDDAFMDALGKRALTRRPGTIVAAEGMELTL